MQIIEVSDFAVRSAVLRLRCRGTALQFVVYPMTHMAEAGFYRAVEARLRGHDLVVAEGIRGASALVSALTMSYRVMRLNRRTGVVEQAIDYRGLGVPVVFPDVTATEFRTGWRAAPLGERLTMWALLPFVVLLRLFGGTRVLWARATTEVDDLTDDDGDVLPGIAAIVSGVRDRRLLDVLSGLHDTRGHEPVEVAVVYGAGHVAAVVHGLADRHGYRPHGAEWLTIVDL